ncbi:TPA: gpW family head-tail joining protein [Burkholderia cenocepacia]
MTGAQEESLSYTQGDGTRSVTYTRANLAQLASAIQLMQAQLGIVACPRRAMRITFTRR